MLLRSLDLRYLIYI